MTPPLYAHAHLTFLVPHGAGTAGMVVSWSAPGKWGTEAGLRAPSVGSGLSCRCLALRPQLTCPCLPVPLPGCPHVALALPSVQERGGSGSGARGGGWVGEAQESEGSLPTTQPTLAQESQRLDSDPGPGRNADQGGSGTLCTSPAHGAPEHIASA